MVDDIAQAPAVQGIEAVQAAGFSLLCFVPAFLLICYRSSRQFACFTCLPLVYLGLSLSHCLSWLFLLFPFLYFSFCFVRCCIFASCMLFVPACFCFTFSPLVIFHVPVHGFVTSCPECGLRSQGDFTMFYSPERN